MAKNTTNTEPGSTALYSSGFFNPVTEQCEGCDRIIEVESAKYCKSYAIPEAKWKLGICNFATHVKPEIKVVTVKINPLKASKRG
ncbi:MAG: PxxKW family cysteine-rich protein [Desulfobulbaceae bacterium]|jgi:hypothetical protein|nr:PxxKW family cysteine-rich protein [Desulfobulbaceae bacterium]